MIVVFFKPGPKNPHLLIRGLSFSSATGMGLSFSSHPKALLGVVGVVTHGLPGIPGDPGKLKPISMKDGRRGTAPAPPFAPVDAGTDIEVETGAPSPWRPTPGKPIHFR